MNLNQEISLDLFKKRAEKKDKGKKDGFDPSQLKTTINFIGIGEKETNWNLAIPGIIVIIVAAVLFAKFGVVDRYARLYAAQSEVSALQDRYDIGMTVLNQSDELSDRFYHYTWSFMTSDEINRTSRVDVAELIEYIGTYGVTVNSYVLSGTDLNISISAPTLETVSRLSQNLRTQKIVATCAVNTAQTTEAEETGAGTVDAQIRISIKTRDEIAAEEASEEAASSEDVSASDEETASSETADDEASDSEEAD